ncbi:MAG TPA: hypothetical protein VEJ42_08090 [Streptosporangiaceae bacterium]|nr:hypothetical protein [Streptosporangiaceae bacterium]
MRRAHDRSSGWQEDQAGQAGQQQAGATGTGPGTAAGAQATGGGETRTTTTTSTYQGSGQPTSSYGTGQAEQRGGYAGQRGGYEPAATESTTHGGLFLLLGGLLTFLVGLAFVVRHGFYHAYAGYAYNWGIVSWGWVLFAVGIVTFAIGAAHLLGLPFSRPFGLVMAVLTAVSGFMVIPFYPLWGIIIVALGIAAVWGLAHGSETERRENERREYERQRQMM